MTRHGLLLDVGNTRCKWKVVRLPLNDDFSCITHLSGSVPTRDLLMKKTSWPGPLDAMAQPDWAVVSNVAGQAVSDYLVDHFLTLWPGLSLRFVKAEQALGHVINAYVKPHTLGVDRWLGLLAAQQRYPGQAVCLASAGSALTIDFLDEHGHHLGGTIAPGLGRQLDELCALLGIAFPAANTTVDWYGTSTIQAARSGAVLMLASVIRAACEHGPCERLLLTGGDAEVLLPHLGDQVEYRECMVFEGLYCWIRAKGIDT